MFLVEMDWNESPPPIPTCDTCDIRNQEWSLPGTVASLDVFKIQMT